MVNVEEAKILHFEPDGGEEGLVRQKSCTKPKPSEDEGFNLVAVLGWLKQDGFIFVQPPEHRTPVK